MAQRATSLGPKPSFHFFCLAFVFFCFAFLSLLYIETLRLPPKKAIFVYLSVFPFVSP